MSDKTFGNEAGSANIGHAIVARDTAGPAAPGTKPARRWREVGLVLTLAALATGTAVFLAWPSSTALATDPATAEAAAPPAMPVEVAVLKARDTMTWDEFSGRLRAVEVVELRSRVAGAVEKIHFREGALVKQGDLLVTIDPAPFEAALSRAVSLQEAAAARVELTRSELERGKQLVDNRVVSVRDLDQRTNNFREAEANLRAADAAVQTAKLDLGYTEVRAPVDGRVGRIEVTVGNLVAAGASSPVLTSLVSVDPIYVSFDADENAVAEALASVGEHDLALTEIDQIPVEITTATTGGRTVRGHLQLVDNQVDTATGTFRLRAVFDNKDRRLVPGQFARVKMGRAKSEPALAVNERAIGTDQDKKFVFVIDDANKAVWRQVTLGPPADGLRVITDGLKEGERIVVNGLQRVRPGAVVAPEIVPMETASAATATDPTTSVAAR
ncbi:efflux RND transporter periplasmic adaptor subunit [Ancylobacter dichloromethanicus]|uniref:MexE family multidrug efflux RND transporter periplasmic adaptor subunit n=1 Tax=Ancylobacter dichloromethanicus TaxID=518825 RepID=A0A9W6JE02_9HYPH|nr:efflux RND transporter periplasmic adaptor subunit [Ancylobacter dichloromethanicus]MBS7552263.1 efflux RND transporter periplasmic adaptor subunit [Ancylobacter dichloromethanicus]GLK73999.1 MexE family multidrug efflux RND transporter periplasmic adaptor subunit [Ancylobacter dichloromethanicus]